jgi:eukaryotic-like serine/threonine-protein kinase
VAVHTGSLLDDRYRVLRHLGSGGMASVLLCEDERLGRQVAVKRLHADSPVDVEQRFAREAKLGASLNHPNLVSVFDTATDDEGVLIVMEYVEGEPLSRMLRRGPLRPEEVASMVRDLGDALDHAHSQGVVHRDVKPGNVLIREDGVTKLADLGIATASDGTKITRSGIVLGTAAYMAPEQLDGRRAGPPADVYALAAISFEALSGKRPREGRTPLEIAHRIANEGAPDLLDAWPTAPKEAARVLQRGMALEPGDRPSSAGEFASELTRALEDAPEETRKTRRLFGRGSKAAAGAAGAGAAGAAAAGAAGAPARPSPPAAPKPAAAPLEPAPTPRHAPAAASPPAASRPRRTPPAAAPPRRTPPVAASRDGGGRARPRAGALALAAIFIALAVATIAGAVLSGGDDEGSSPSSADNTPAEPKADANKKEKQEEPKAKKEPKDEPATAAPAPEQEEQEEQPTGSYNPDQGAALNDDAYVLMQQGDYADAIPKLQEAVKLFPPDSTDIRYAYTLFNLGKSLRAAGQPAEAIPYLEKRLQWDDQTDVVQAELDKAKQEAGQG